MIEPTDIVALLNAADAAAALTGGRGGTVPVNAAQLRELVVVWLRVAAKHEEIGIRPHLYAIELRELVELMLFGADDDSPPPRPFLRCHCGEEFLPSAPHCPRCGEVVQ